jgi:hypothetical protein
MKIGRNQISLPVGVVEVVGVASALILLVWRAETEKMGMAKVILTKMILDCSQGVVLARI